MKLLYPLLLLILATVSGCAPHPRALLPGTRYRISQPGFVPLTLPPPIAELAPTQPLELEFPVSLGPSALAKRAAPGSPCSEQNPIFSIRIDRKTRRLALSMPSLMQWQKKLLDWDQPDPTELESKLDQMLAAPEKLEARGCLSPGSATLLRQLLRDSIPTRPGFDLYPAYGYRPSGLGLDLKAGVRFKIQRAHFNSPPPEDGKRSITDLTGISTVYYEARTDGRQRTVFGRPLVEYDSPKLKDALAKGWEDLDFARHARPQILYRLFFLTSYARNGLRRTALVLGTPSIALMESMHKQLTANPAIACDELTRGTSSTCVSFEGDVTVSAEVEVTINGARTFLEWNTSVKSVMGKVPGAQQPGRSIRLLRIYDGRVLPVEADPKLGVQLENTVLIAGDELSWR